MVLTVRTCNEIEGWRQETRAQRAASAVGSTSVAAVGAGQELVLNDFQEEFLLFLGLPGRWGSRLASPSSLLPRETSGDLGEQPAPHCGSDCRCALGHVELLVEVLEVCLDRGLTEMK
jgi:hypothetical protein